MKKLSIFVVVLIAIGAATYMWWPNVQRVPEQEIEQPGRLMSIEDYVSQNISALSPVKEEVGGKFFVTEIEAANGKGAVSYEDGHNAYTADFTYVTSDLGYSVTSFIIRQQ